MKKVYDYAANGFIETGVISDSGVTGFREMHSSGGQVYASMKLSGDSYHNIYRINADGTYMRLTDDTGDFLRPRASRNGKHIGYIKSNGTQTVCAKDLIANTETAAEVFPDEAEIDIAGWNRSSSNLVYSVVVNELGGKPCNPNIEPNPGTLRYYEINAKLYSTELNNVSDLGIYQTVDKKMRFDTIDMEEALLYSRYEGNGSSVCAVKMELKTVLVSSPDSYTYSCGITGNDEETHPGFTEEPTPEELNAMKLTPYTGLDSEPLIRYLYTGREYNTETGDYYYRYRMMEAGIGRFTSKDLIVKVRDKYIINKYYYANNNSIKLTDCSGLDAGDLKNFSIKNSGKCNSYFKSKCKNGNDFTAEYNRMETRTEVVSQEDFPPACKDNARGSAVNDGCYAYSGPPNDREGTIYINKDANWRDQNVALLHELLHSCGYDGQDSAGGDQPIIDACTKP